MFGLTRINLGAMLLMTGIISLLCCGIWQYTLYQQVFAISDKITNTRNTIQAINQTLIAINRAGLGVSNYVITNYDVSVAKIPELIITADINIQALQQLIEDNPTELKIFSNLLPIYNDVITHLKKIMTAYQAGDKQQAVALTTELSKNLLIKKTNSMILGIKNIELAQLQFTESAYEFYKIKANKTVIILRMLNILLLTIAYILIRTSKDKL